MVTCGTRLVMEWHGGSEWRLVNMSLGWDGSDSRGLFCGFEMYPPAFEKQTGCLAAGQSSTLLETELLSSPSQLTGNRELATYKFQAPGLTPDF